MAAVHRSTGNRSASITFPLAIATPAGITNGDLELMVAECATANSISITSAAGGAWTLIDPGSNGYTVTVAGGQKLYVWWRIRAVGDSGTPTLTATADALCACRIAFKVGTFDTTTPFEAVTTSTETTSDTSMSHTGGTSSGYSNAVVCIASILRDSGTGSVPVMANTSLESMALIADHCTNAGAGGGYGISYGRQSEPGDVGTFTTTYLTASAKSMVSFVIRPKVPAAVTTGALGTPRLDDFDRAPSGDLSAGGAVDWAENLFSQAGRVWGRRFSNENAALATQYRTVPGGGGIGGTLATFGGDVESWLQLVSGVPSLSETLSLFMTDPATSKTLALNMTVGDQTWLALDGVSLVTVATPTVSPGDAWSLSREGTTVRGWRKPAGGVWTKILEKTNAGFGTGRVNIGFATGTDGINAPGIEWDNFGGGPNLEPHDGTAVLHGGGSIVATVAALRSRTAALTAGARITAAAIANRAASALITAGGRFPAAGPNLLTNPGSETGRSTYQYGTGTIAVQSSEQAFSGTYSTKITTPGLTIGGGGEGSIVDANSQPGGRPNGIAGRGYRFSEWIKAPAGAQLLFYAQFFNAGGGYLGYGGAGGMVAFTGTGNWQKVEATVTAPANTAKMAIAVRTTGTPQALTWFEDELYIGEAAAATGIGAHTAAPRLAGGGAGTAGATTAHHGTAELAGGGTLRAIGAGLARAGRALFARVGRFARGRGGRANRGRLPRR